MVLVLLMNKSKQAVDVLWDTAGYQINNHFFRMIFSIGVNCLNSKKMKRAFSRNTKKRFFITKIFPVHRCRLIRSRGFLWEERWEKSSLFGSFFDKKKCNGIPQYQFKVFCFSCNSTRIQRKSSSFVIPGPDQFSGWWVLPIFLLYLRAQGRVRNDGTKRVCGIRQSRWHESYLIHPKRAKW